MPVIVGKEWMVADERRRYPRRFALAQAMLRPIYLRREQREGWKGKLPLYVVWCPECEIFSVTYPAGYLDRIECRRCRRFHQVMSWRRFRQEVAPRYLPFIILILFCLLALRLCGAV